MTPRIKLPIVPAPDTSRQKGIWIASYPKSGNTWVRIFVLNLLREVEGRKDGAQDINRLGHHTEWEINSSDYDRELGKPALEATRIEIARARYDVQGRIASTRPGPFFLKTHNAIANVEGYPTVNLDVMLSAIYVVRNPLDVAISYAHHSSFTIDAIIGHMAEAGLASPMTKTAVYEFMGSWSFNVASWLSVPTRPVHLVRYEDMLNAPERTFGALADFLRLKPSAEQLRGAIEKSSFKALAKQEATHGFVERPPNAAVFFREGKAGQWKDMLTPEQIKTVVSAHAPMMQRCGYLPADCGGDIGGLLRVGKAH